MRLVFKNVDINRLIYFPITYNACIFQKIIMTVSMLTNETKRHAVIVALKADHGDLQMQVSSSVARTFVHNPNIWLTICTTTSHQTFGLLTLQTSIH